LIGEAQGIPLVRRLELSLAGRYTSYGDAGGGSAAQDYGDGFDPKVGVLWAPFDIVSFRGTYGTSFRAPALTQGDTSGGQSTLRRTNVDGVAATVLTVAGYPADLGPETAKTYTVGFDFRPLPDFRLSATYYNIDYSDRISVAPTGGLNAFTNPGLLPDVIYRPGSAGLIQEALAGRAPRLVGMTLPGVDLSDPAAVAAAIYAQSNLWVFDQRFRNLALSQQDGIDLALNYRFDLPWAEMAVGAYLTRILSYRQQGSDNSAVLTAVDYVGLPTDLRSRVYATVTSGSVSATINVNYADDTRLKAAAGGWIVVDSWTTTDLALNFDLGALLAVDSLHLSINALNLFDEDPPFVNQDGIDQIGFDATNANPLGRVVTVGLTAHW
jgi:iron complex outermembrane receptor protein